ncbi:hypothetical protein [Thalassotalea crassostreae]|uniref:hypothetical protein n=1 Tax=Thalassotalea crassostreae TaxID=1763536 RepID=UPI000838ACA9|nr:hypothetical protein [Thalassotalea crassostreae]
MVNAAKMRAQLEQINGRQYHYTKVDLCRYSNEQICRQAINGNKAFILELIRRAEFAEEEGDYLIANELYKSMIKGLL